MKKRIFRIFVLIVLLILFVFRAVKKEPVQYFTAEIPVNEMTKTIQIIHDEDSLNEYVRTDDSIIPELSGIDRKFFTEKILIAVSVEEPSKDITHEIISLEEKCGEMIVCVKRNIPGKVSSVKGYKTYFVISDREDILGINNYVIKFI